MSKSVLIKDLEFWYAKLDKPVSPFGTEQWELQVRTNDKGTKKDLEDAGIKVSLKEDENGNPYYAAGLKRKTTNKKGEPMDPPRVVDAHRQAFPHVAKIGNGTRGNVILFSYDYEVQGRSGTAAMLTAVQVVDFKPYEGGGDGIDFDVEADAPSGGGSSEGGEIDFG